jgi:uncharacterized protein (TIGR02217 family)
MAFFECEFPRTIAFKRLGGDGFFTTVNKGFGGQEQRNKNWSQTHAKYTVDLTTPGPLTVGRLLFIEQLRAFFDVVSGQGDAFRFYDHVNGKARGQIIGVGNGALTVFQLTKTSTVGPPGGGLTRSYVRNLTKIVDPSVMNYLGVPLRRTLNIYLNGVVQAVNAYTLDATTGLVTFDSAPGGAVVITADCEFDIPVRFNKDQYEPQVEESDIPGGQPIISVHSVELVEVLPPNY